VVAVTRYSVKVGDRWVAASYSSSGPGILLTNQGEDAGSWVTHEKAAEVAQLATQFFKETAWIYVAEEADVPSSWNAYKGACAVMTDLQIELALQDWWAESFPRAPINKQNAGNMVAFASHVLALAELYREYETPSSTND